MNEQPVRKSRSGTWALYSLVFGILMGMRTISILDRGSLSIPFYGDATQAGQPIAFYIAVAFFGLLSVFALIGAYSYWEEWRAAKARAD